MNVEQELGLLQCVSDDFKAMHGMLTDIEQRIAQYPATIQLDFIKFMKNVLFEANMDAINSEDNYLNRDTPPLTS